MPIHAHKSLVLRSALRASCASVFRKSRTDAVAPGLQASSRVISSHVSFLHLHMSHWQWAVLCFVLPMLDTMKISWIFTALPLNWTDAGWSLTSLAIVMGGNYAPRMAFTLAVKKFGDWLLVAACCIALLATVPMLIWPTNMASIYVAIFTCGLAISPQALQSLIFRLYGSDQDVQRSAMRTFQLGTVLGYSMGPLWGGVLYDYAGVRGCAVFQAANLGAQVALSATLPIVRKDAATHLGLSRPPMQRSLDEHAAVEDVHATPKSEAPAPATAPATAPPPAQEGAWAEGAMQASPARAPAYWALGAFFTSLFMYLVEWNLYALFFRHTYAWSGVWTGAAQMSGDLFAGFLLLASTTTRAKQALLSLRARRRAPLTLLLDAPYNVTLLMLIHGTFMLMLAQPTFGVSLVGQVRCSMPHTVHRCRMHTPSSALPKL